MLPRPDTGMTRVELVVVLGIFLVLFTVFLPHGCTGTSTLARTQMTQTLSNMKQLHLATQQMALDGETNKNPALGWPGDTGDSFTHWATTLVKEDYLTTNDLRKLLSAPGKIAPENPAPSMNESALLLYAVRSNSPANTLMLSTANFTNTPTGGILDTNAVPYGKKGLVIFHRGGTGMILRPKDATNPKYVGSYAPLCH